MSLRELIDFSQYATDAELAAAIAALSSTYQPILVSGTSIKTVEGQSLLGSGNVAINALSLSGGTVSGPIITPIGSISNCAIGIGGANHGLYNELAGASGAVWIVHNGTGVFRSRFDSNQSYVNLMPGTNGNLQLGSNSLAWSGCNSVQFRSGPGSAAAPGYHFNVSGTTVLSGMYAISTTTLGFSLNGTSAATFTSSGLTLQTGTFLPTPYITATLPSASANSSRCCNANGAFAQSDGTNWRYLRDNSIVT